MNIATNMRLLDTSIAIMFVCSSTRIPKFWKQVQRSVMKRSSVLTTTEFVVNKDRTRGCRHGTTRDKFSHYKAKEDKKEARKHDCNSMHERKILDTKYYESGRECLDRTDSGGYGELTLTDRSYVATMSTYFRN